MIFDKEKWREFIFVNRRVRYIPLEIFSRICQKKLTKSAKTDPRAIWSPRKLILISLR